MRIQESPTDLAPARRRVFAYRVSARLAAGVEILPPKSLDGVVHGNSLQIENGWIVDGVKPTDGSESAQQFGIVESGFPDWESASQKGAEVLDAFRVVAARQGMGVDLGETSSGLATLPTGKQLQVRIDDGKDANGNAYIACKYGLHVFEDLPRAGFVTVGAGQTGNLQRVDNLLGAVVWHLQHPLRLSRRQRVSCELLNAIPFESGARARFLLTVAAVEALLEPAERVAVARELVERMIRQVHASSVPQADKNSLLGSLRWLRHESISRTGRALSDRLLGQARYLKLTPGKFFERLYTARSKLLHTGDPQIPLADFESLAKVAENFARDLFFAHVERGGSA